jgi:hypothetical protein
VRLRCDDFSLETFCLSLWGYGEIAEWISSFKEPKMAHGTQDIVTEAGELTPPELPAGRH